MENFEKDFGENRSDSESLRKLREIENFEKKIGDAQLQEMKYNLSAAMYGQSIKCAKQLNQGLEEACEFLTDDLEKWKHIETNLKLQREFLTKFQTLNLDKISECASLKAKIRYERLKEEQAIHMEKRRSILSRYSELKYVKEMICLEKSLTEISECAAKCRNEKEARVREKIIREVKIEKRLHKNILEAVITQTDLYNLKSKINEINSDVRKADSELKNITAEIVTKKKQLYEQKLLAARRRLAEISDPLAVRKLKKIERLEFLEPKRKLDEERPAARNLNMKNQPILPLKYIKLTSQCGSKAYEDGNQHLVVPGKNVKMRIQKVNPVIQSIEQEIPKISTNISKTEEIGLNIKSTTQKDDMFQTSFQDSLAISELSPYIERKYTDTTSINKNTTINENRDCATRKETIIENVKIKPPVQSLILNRDASILQKCSESEMLFESNDQIIDSFKLLKQNQLTFKSHEPSKMSPKRCVIERTLKTKIDESPVCKKPKITILENIQIKPRDKKTANMNKLRESEMLFESNDIGESLKFICKNQSTFKRYSTADYDEKHEDNKPLNISSNTDVEQFLENKSHGNPNLKKPEEVVLEDIQVKPHERNKMMQRLASNMGNFTESEMIFKSNEEIEDSLQCMLGNRLTDRAIPQTTLFVDTISLDSTTPDNDGKVGHVTPSKEGVKRRKVVFSTDCMEKIQKVARKISAASSLENITVEDSPAVETKKQNNNATDFSPQNPKILQPFNFDIDKFLMNQGINQLNFDELNHCDDNKSSQSSDKRQGRQEDIDDTDFGRFSAQFFESFLDKN